MLLRLRVATGSKLNEGVPLNVSLNGFFYIEYFINVYEKNSEWVQFVADNIHFQFTMLVSYPVSKCSSSLSSAIV